MKKRKILWLSELRYLRESWAGGYSAITEGVCTGLHELGHEVKVLAISYNGEPHSLPFSVVPFLTFQYAMVQLTDILEGWWPDALVVALDVPYQADIYINMRSLCRYIAVIPIEGEPITPRWADALANLDHLFTLSEFGVAALKQAGLKSTYLPLAATLGYGRAEPEVLADVRKKAMVEGRFVILKVADNHSRKNWAHTFEFFARWAKPDCTLYAVTRPENQLGWDLQALIEEYGGGQVKGTTVWRWPDGKDIRMLNNLSRNDLAWTYNLARDRGVLLMDTGGEGVGLPTLEAFAVGVPVVGMRHTATGELLADGRGITFGPGYEYRDIFGNSRRYYPDYTSWSQAMETAYHDSGARQECVRKAMAWIMKRTWQDAARVLEAAL